MTPAANARPVLVSPRALKVGEIVGQYEILAPLGGGGMGAVYKVRRGEGIFVLKILTSYFFDGVGASGKQREQHMRAVSEFLPARVLAHPNIVRQLSFDVWPDLTSGYPYIIMEYVDGFDICGWRAEIGPSLRRICDVLRQVADALGHMHAQGFIHRDLKAANILVRRGKDEAVVIDLGVARHEALPPVTEQAAIIGTKTHYAPEYVRWFESPAAVRGEPFAWTPLVDLYALGYVAYEVLTGSPPVSWCGGTEVLLAAIRNDPAVEPRELNPAIPEPLAALVMQLLEKEPGARPGSAIEVRGTLESVLATAGPPYDEEPFPVPAPAPQEADAGAVPQFMPGRWMPSWCRVQMEAAADEQGGPVVNACVEPSRSAEIEAHVTDPGVSTALRSESTPAPRQAPAETAISSAIRKGRERLAASAPRLFTGRVLGAAALGVAGCVLVGFMLASWKKPAAKDDMLARLEREQAGAAKGGPAGKGVAAVSQIPLELRAVPGLVPRVSTPDAAAPSASDAKNIDAALAARYGRPTVAPADGAAADGAAADGAAADSAVSTQPADATEPAGSAAPPAGAPPDAAPSRRVVRAVHARGPVNADPFFYGESLDGSPRRSPGDGPRKFGIAMGTHIRARLLSSLDSRTIGSGVVEAVLTQPLILRGEVVLPARTMLYGRAQENLGRFNIEFTRLRLPDDTEVEFHGTAMDLHDNKPGLAASARVTPPGYEGEGVGVRVARQTGNAVLNTVSGGLVEDVARGAGSTIVNHQAGNLAGGADVPAILLDGGVIFEVFVAATF